MKKYIRTFQILCMHLIEFYLLLSMFIFIFSILAFCFSCLSSRLILPSNYCFLDNFWLFVLLLDNIQSWLLLLTYKSELHYFHALDVHVLLNWLLIDFLSLNSFPWLVNSGDCCNLNIMVVVLIGNPYNFCLVINQELVNHDVFKIFLSLRLLE